MSVRQSPGVPSEMSLSEIKARLSEVVRIVENGGRVIITKRGLPVVDLIPHDPIAKLPLLSIRKQPSQVKPKAGPSVEEIVNELRGDR